MNRPPCWPDGQPCPNACAAALYERQVYNRHALPEPWTGWRFAGRVLVSPDGDRIPAERLRGLLWRQAQEARAAAARSREKRFAGVACGLVRSLAKERKPDGR